MLILNSQNNIFAFSIFFAASGPAAAQGQEGEPPVFGLAFVETRQSLEERGVAFGATLLADLSSNISGGDDNAGAFRHLFEFGVTLDLEKAAGIEGGGFFISLVTQEGQDGSEETGDLQAFSNIDSEDFTALYEIYYQQAFLGGGARVKVGKFDANSEFAFVDNGGEFIHSSPGVSPTVLALPTFPDPAFGVIGFIGEGGGPFFGAGLFDGALQEGVSTGSLGPSTFFNEPADLFLIGEAGYAWDAPLAGRIAGGVWHHTGAFDRFDGGTEDGTVGAYIVFDQQLYKENQDPDDGQGVGLFAQYGFADADVSEIEQHYSAGFRWAGAIPTRDEDVWGLMVSAAVLTDEPGAGLTETAETAIEWFYRVRLGQNLVLQPDVQYIVNPGGGGLDDAVVIGLRLEAAY